LKTDFFTKNPPSPAEGDSRSFLTTPIFKIWRGSRGNGSILGNENGHFIFLTDKERRGEMKIFSPLDPAALRFGILMFLILLALVLRILYVSLSK